MLVLTRKLGEAIVVSDETGRQVGTLKPLEIRSGQVKLGFEFDRSYKLMRIELVTDDREREAMEG